jgi:Na+/proline symporter
MAVMNSILPYLLVAASFLSASSVFLQARLIRRNHSDSNVSHVQYLVIFTVNILWILYAIQLNSMTLLITSLVAGLGALAVILADLLYAHRGKGKKRRRARRRRS